MIEQSKLESAIHHYLVRGLIDDGFAPDTSRCSEGYLCQVWINNHRYLSQPAAAGLERVQSGVNGPTSDLPD
jgi:hypothetical protein